MSRTTGPGPSPGDAAGTRHLVLAVGSGAVATLLGATALATRRGDAAAVAALVVAALGLLAFALLRERPGAVGPSVGLLALAVATGNGAMRLAVPAQAAALVAVALSAWWSIDDRRLGPVDRGIDRRRRATSTALVAAAAVVAGIVVVMPSVVTAGLAPAVGAVGAVGVPALLWSLLRWRRYEEEAAP